MSDWWIDAMKSQGRWPGKWVTDPGDFRTKPLWADAEGLADRAAEATRRGALNADGTPCVAYWCSAGFDHPLGLPYYEFPPFASDGGDPRHNAYCKACAEKILAKAEDT